MDYNELNDNTKIPEKGEVVLVRANNAIDGIIITQIKDGKQVGEEVSYEDSDVTFDPLAGISQEAQVYVQPGASDQYERAKEFSDLFNDCNGNLDVIGDTLEANIINGEDNDTESDEEYN